MRIQKKTLNNKTKERRWAHPRFSGVVGEVACAGGGKPFHLSFYGSGLTLFFKHHYDLHMVLSNAHQAAVIYQNPISI
jgi:hypothetical protein